MKNFENPKFLIKLIGMNPLTKKEKIIIIAVILGVGLAIAAGAVTIAHSASRALKIYTQAFEDYKAGNLQNSYYQTADDIYNGYNYTCGSIPFNKF